MDYINLPVLGGSGGTSLPGIYTPLPADGWVGIANAMEEATAAGGGTVYLEPGAVYEDTTPINVPTGKYMCNVHLKGNGATLRFNGSVADNEYIFAIRGTQYGNNKAISDVTVGDTSITLTTPANALLYQEGDIIVIQGTDTSGLQDVVYGVVADIGNGISGVVDLITVVSKTLTTCVVLHAWGSEYNTECANNFNSVEDITFELENPQAASFYAVYIEGEREFLLKNIQVKDASASISNQNPIVQVVGCFNSVIENVSVFGSTRAAFEVLEAFGTQINNCYSFGVEYNGGGGAIQIRNASDNIFFKNMVLTSQRDGITCQGSNLSRRNVFRQNSIIDCLTQGISLNSTGYDCRIENNYLERIHNEGAIYIQKDNNIVTDNVMNRCKFGVYTQGGAATVIDGNTIKDSTSYAIILSISSSLDCVVSNNSINGGGGGDAAIYLSQGSNLLVDGNVITSRTGRGIQLETAVLNSLVTGNMISDVSSDGINVSDDSDYNLVSNNHMVGLTLVQGTGANNDFIGNKVA